MRRLALIIISFALFFHPDCSAQISEKLSEYLSAIDRLSIPDAQAELDFMISSVQDDSLRNEVATAAYRHFRESKIMGSENLAVYLYDSWFADFKALLPSVDEFEQAGLYAFINRKSLIGAQAETLTLSDERGEEITLPRNGRWNVIFFYSATCPKCLYTAMQLSDFLSRKGIYSKAAPKRLKINVFTIYTGEDHSEWANYCREHLNFVKCSRIKTYNLIAGDADIVTSYGVVQTPRLFLVDAEGRIAGRNLDVPALCKLLK